MEGKSLTMHGLKAFPLHSAEQPGNAGTAADFENAGIRHVLAAEASGSLQAQHPFIYASAEDLCVGDVELVLSAYKQMVR